MGCNRDSGCLKLAKSVYPSLQESVSSSVNNINNQIEELLGTLSNLYIPEDYLGNKVKEELTEICEGLEGVKGNVDSFSGSIDTFISQRINEHQIHYNNWRQSQQKRLDNLNNEEVDLQD